MWDNYQIPAKAEYSLFTEMLQKTFLQPPDSESQILRKTQAYLVFPLVPLSSLIVSRRSSPVAHMVVLFLRSLGQVVHIRPAAPCRPWSA